MIETSGAGRTQSRWRAVALAAMICLLVSPSASWAQRGRFRAPCPPRAPRIRRQNRAWRRQRIRQDQHKHAPNFFRQLRDLPPDQQDKVLRNDSRFHNLPAWRRQQIRANLRRWNSLTPRQRQVLRQRQEILESMSPAQRQDARRVFPEYNRLPAAQQQQVMRAFRRMRNLSLEQRQRFLNSRRFERRFTPQQQDVLRGLGGLLPP